MNNNTTLTLSIVIPCYNEEENIPLVYAETLKQEQYFREKGVGFEFVYVDDGSRDKTAQAVRTLREKDERVHLVSFSRNFGKESAIYAGLEKASGEVVVVMDADLQDPPGLLPTMYSHIEDGREFVGTRRVNRKGEPPIRSWFARRFYRLMRKISRTDIVDGARDYRMMTKKVRDAILSMKEYNRFSKGIFGWVGFDIKWLEYENVKRAAGETKWSFRKLFLYSLEGIMAFSTMPLMLAMFFGMIFCVIALALLIFVIVRTAAFGDPFAGVPLVICAVMFVGGIQLFCVGILGMYLSKTYLEVKQRPLYIVKEEF